MIAAKTVRSPLRMRGLVWALGAAIGLGSATSADAALVKYILEGVFDYSVVPADVAVGDEFRITFELDHAKVDTSFTTSFGVFGGSVPTLKYEVLGSPSGGFPGGEITAPLALTTSRSIGIDNIGINYNRSNGSAGTFGQVGGEPLHALALTFRASGTPTYTDTGQGQTMQQHFGGLFDPTKYNGLNQLNFSSVSKTLALASITSAVRVPEPSTAMILAMAAGALASGRRRA